jgi:transcription initiation factor TFIIB
MVRFSSPECRRVQRSQTEDHQEENQNYYYHQKQCILPTGRSTVKENDQNDVVESQEQNVFLCYICKSDKLVTDPESGEIICSNCGIVISDKIQQINKPEWRNFDAEQSNNNNNNNNNNRIRTGAPTSIARHDMGLATVIGRTDRDASGHKIDAQMRSTMERLRTWDFRTQRHTATDRNLSLAFNELDTLKDKLGLPDAVFQKAAYIYRKAQARGLVRGRSISSVLAASIYIACREAGISKTLKDIVAASNISRKNISKTYRKLLVELDYKVPVFDPKKCIARVANNANLSEKTKHQALYIMNEVAEKEISVGKNPMGLAATVLYASCVKTGENKAQKDIAEAASVTEVTLRNRLKDLKSKIELSKRSGAK